VSSRGAVLVVRPDSPGRPQVCYGYSRQSVGAWRSLVARFHGVEEVAGSNLVAPTSFKLKLALSRLDDGSARFQLVPILRLLVPVIPPGARFPRMEADASAFQ
jgi:hypothetical protein